MRQSLAERTEREEAIASLREWIKPGDTIYTILRHVSRSGMQREISLRKVAADGSMIGLDYNAALTLGERIGKHDGIIVASCGMDMGFHVVYNLGRVLFPQGIGAQCRKCSKRPCQQSDGGVVSPRRDSNGDLYCTGPCPAWDLTTPEGEYFGHEFYGRNGDRGPWEPDGGYALEQRWL